MLLEKTTFLLHSKILKVEKTANAGDDYSPTALRNLQQAESLSQSLKYPTTHFCCRKKPFLVLLSQASLGTRRFSLVSWRLIYHDIVAQQSHSIKKQFSGVDARPFTYTHLGKLRPKNTVNSHHQM